MKKLPALILDAKLIPNFDEEKAENVEAMPTFRRSFKLAIGQGQSRTADESRRALRVLNKLRQPGDVELTDDEFKTLLDRTAFNQAQFITAMHGQLLEILDEINK